LYLRRRKKAEKKEEKEERGEGRGKKLIILILVHENFAGSKFNSGKLSIKAF
jgi:hypothetical protein